jgi:tetratricopeptide (TPR) repeat protein
MLRRSGQFQASLGHYEYIVTSDPRVPEARFGYAASLIRLRRYAEARERLEAAMRDDPSQAAFANATARLLAAAPDDRVRDGRRALAMIQGLIDRGVRTSDALETMAMAQAEVGQFSAAVTWQRDAMAAAERTAGLGVAGIMADNLRLYEAGKPCRTPWRPDEPLEFLSTAADPALDAGRGGALR